ncbi:hypothetical protein O3M35_012485 [Rhynocoris fuscipes]|uniref:Uncharacterized protein n=1 Tax=Rhynocoris fuscipes TaxID=488301 RepID=A0AAW1CV18_9HEMI
MNSDLRTSVLGNFSFKGDSLPDFSEFDSDSVIDEYHRESSLRPPDDRMAPTTTIETITVTRPLKVSFHYVNIINISYIIIKKLYNCFNDI